MHTFFHYQWVRGRKPHRCDGCGWKMPKGTVQKVQTSNYDGQMGTCRVCLGCSDLVEMIHRHSHFLEEVVEFEVIGEIADDLYPDAPETIGYHERRAWVQRQHQEAKERRLVEDAPQPEVIS